MVPQHLHYCNQHYDTPFKQQPNEDTQNDPYLDKTLHYGVQHDDTRDYSPVMLNVMLTIMVISFATFSITTPT
jgi:hypothetical protein